MGGYLERKSAESSGMFKKIQGRGEAGASPRGCPLRRAGGGPLQVPQAPDLLPRLREARGAVDCPNREARRGGGTWLSCVAGRPHPPRPMFRRSRGERDQASRALTCAPPPRLGPGLREQGSAFTAGPPSRRQGTERRLAQGQ